LDDIGGGVEVIDLFMLAVSGHVGKYVADLSLDVWAV